MRASRALTLLIGACLVSGGCGSGSAQRAAKSTSSTAVSPDAAVASTAPPCGGHAAPATYAHVLIIVMENHDFAQVADHSPFLNRLASQCGLATNSHGVAHPSLPNYVALTSGGTQGITTDCTSCSTGAANIFGQVTSSGWKSYEEDMPSVGFSGASSGKYVKRHNPPAYFTSVASAFATQSVPLGAPEAGPLADDLTKDTLPKFGFVTPNLCDDEHDCSVATGDTWLSGWVPRILGSSAYRAGGTALFITYDENDGRGANHIYTVAVSPSVPPKSSSPEAFDHYSLLATVEDLLGLSRLGQATAATSMRPAFHL